GRGGTAGPRHDPHRGEAACARPRLRGGGIAMHVSVVRPADLGVAEIDAWHAMQDQTESLANPFLSPEFTVAVARARPGTAVAVLTDSAGFAGFFPFERRRLGVGMPAGAGL